jgi:hypothetical protein
MTTIRQVAVLWIAQVTGNAALLALGLWWLNWPDARTWQVTGSFVVALAAVFALLWLHCGTLASFAEPPDGLGSHFRHALRRLPAFLIWVIALAALLWWMQWWSDRLPQITVRLGQVLHVSPRTMLQLGEWKIFALRWIVIPLLLWPFAFAIAGRGFRGWHPRALRILRRGRYWIGIAVALVGGFAIPYKLIFWEHAAEATSPSFRHEAWSMGLRFTVAYLLCVTSWLALAVMMKSEDLRMKNEE